MGHSGYISGKDVIKFNTDYVREEKVQNDETSVDKIENVVEGIMYQG